MDSEHATTCQSECIDHGKKGMVTGYASTRLPMSAGYGRRNVLSHRWAYVQAHHVGLDSIAGLVIRHTCDNPRCINPSHLLVGTHKDNTADALTRGRFVVGVAHKNAKLTEAQVAEIRQSPLSSSQLASIYGVGRRVISRIISREDWRHIP